MSAPPAYMIQTVLNELAQAFPEHGVTLVLRARTGDPNHDVVATTEETFIESAALLGQRALINFHPTSMNA